ncbi:MAG: PAS domain S-box protein [Salinivirgaceae bacterium]|jgi:PAS domain S-box-containing protein|nr:PAS domain S-box protein [Salinivirgaceae bacterium]
MNKFQLKGHNFMHYFWIIFFIWSVLIGFFANIERLIQVNDVTQSNMIEHSAFNSVLLAFIVLWLVGSIGIVIGYYLIITWYRKLKITTDELEAAHQKHDLHIKNTPLAVLEWDLDFNVTRWNKAAENIFGYSENEVLGKYSSFILTENVRPLADEILEGLLAQTGGERSTNDNLTKDGALITCEWYNTPLKSENGEVIGVTSLVQNITDRKQAEEALLQKNHELEAAEEEIRATNEELVATNNALKNNMHELEAAEEEVRASNEELIATNGTLKANMRELEGTDEIVRSSLAYLEEKNEHLIEKENALNNANKMLQLVIDHIPERVFWKDLDSNYLGCNKNFALDAGCEKTKDAIGKNDMELYENHLAQRYRLLDFEIINSGLAKINMEETEGDETEGQRFFKTNRVPIRDDQNRIIGVLGTYEDITSLKKMQEDLVASKIKAEESDRLKSSFLANMSHEIRTPMNGIIGFSQLLSVETKFDENTREYIDIIMSSGEQLLSIVDDILNISKIETGQVTVYNKEVDVTSFLQKMLPVFELKAQNNNNAVKLNINIPESKNRVVTDATKLQQVISNMITNAIKFTNNGIVEYGCSFQNGALQFYVKDNGIGILKEQTAKIFDRFLQLGKTAIENQGGVGLGLSICRGLVSLLGGEIWVESEEGLGSTFYFTIPFTDQLENDELHTNTNKGMNTDNFNFSGKTILIAEDDITNHKVLEHMLFDTKATLIKAYNGKEAVELIKAQQNIDLVLMDIKMPVMNGYDAALEIKAINPDIPIIAQTAFALDENRDEFMDDRFNDYLTKPIMREVFFCSIQKELNTREILKTSDI